MLSILRTENEELVPYSIEQEVPEGSWFSLVHPSADEMEQVSRIAQVEEHFLHAPLDPEESSRMEIDDGSLFIIINVPKDRKSQDDDYDTIPIGIVVTPKYFITVCNEDNNIINKFASGNFKFFNTSFKTRFLFMLLFRSAILFLKDLRQITRISDRVEDDLRKTMKNDNLFLLLDMQKGLTYYTIALKSNKVVVEKLLRMCTASLPNALISHYEEDGDLLEDVHIEYEQAMEMAQIQTDVLGGITDTFASVISNNLNIVMKYLTSITIVLAVPTLLSGLFGMNVPVPYTNHPWGFAIVIGWSVLLTICAVIWLWKKHLF
ncbi:MAG: magnesium transporter CorA family protein [Synergistaceae bacterium]|nr:magnesium transporter CorA family protein [Synergistaceae bacterium]